MWYHNSNLTFADYEIYAVTSTAYEDRLGWVNFVAQKYYSINARDPNDPAIMCNHAPNLDNYKLIIYIL